jgi:hypothetical protein
VRRVVVAAFAFAGLATATIAAVYPSPGWGFALFGIAGIAVVALDAVGTVPFLRAVRARERVEMTMVFITYGQISQLGPMIVFSVLLSFLELPAVFVATAVLLLWASSVSRFIPRSM